MLLTSAIYIDNINKNVYIIKQNINGNYLIYCVPTAGKPFLLEAQFEDFEDAQAALFSGRDAEEFTSVF